MMTWTFQQHNQSVKNQITDFFLFIEHYTAKTYVKNDLHFEYWLKLMFKFPRNLAGQCNVNFHSKKKKGKKKIVLVSD